MGNFFAELRHRHIYRVAAAYAVVAWVLLQLFNNLEPILKLPGWAGTLVLVFLVGGLPVALLLAWVRELGPADGSATRATTGKLDWVLIGALVAVIALVSYQQLAPVTGSRTAQQASLIPAAFPTSPLGVISVAVLPFVNLSSDKEQEFFSDGMTEEITSALAKVQNLRVVGRTSAFEFKGQNKDLRAIGQALSATHLIEGSVRKDGNEVRITAQLIKADDGTHLWTESYNRELKGVFAIQEEIAQAIAASLRVPLGLKPGETLVSNRTGDPESYDQYLRAKALYHARAIAESIEILESVVARDPGFVPAWALLASSYNLLPNYSPTLRTSPVEEAHSTIKSIQSKAEGAAQKAVRLDPQYAAGYGALADMNELRGKWVDAADFFRKALALDPNDPEILQRYRVMLAVMGRLKESLALSERIRMLDPFVPIYNSNTAVIMQFNGQATASITVLDTVPAGSAGGLLRNSTLARAYAGAGRYAEAADTLLAISGNQVSRRSVEDAARLLRTAAAKTQAPHSLPELEGELSFVYAYVGALDRVLDYPERSIAINFLGLSAVSQVWHPLSAPLRKTERFKALLRNMGLVDYWRARGWPDLCRPVGADDFVCD